jgi:hypothetical protein
VHQWNLGPLKLGFSKTTQELGVGVLSPHGMLEPWILADKPLKKKIGLFYTETPLVKPTIC